MEKMKRIGRFLGLAALAAGVFVLLGFVGSVRSSAICETVEIRFSAASVGLVSESDVRLEIGNSIGEAVGMPMRSINKKVIEETVESLPHVGDVVAYTTIDKKLIIEVAERKPIVRLIDGNGVHATLDEYGNLIPVPAKTALRLPVITGDFVIGKGAIGERINANDTLAGKGLSEVWRYASYISADEFWRTQIQHTVFSKGSFTAYPQVGNHKLLFGSTTDLKDKLKRLEIFYQRGMNEALWNKYTSINLKYKDQIVCTKK